jgi:hypothetical protein
LPYLSVLLERLFLQLLHAALVLDFNAVDFILRSLSQLLALLVHSSLVVSSQLVHLAALIDELGTQLVFHHCVLLKLLSQLLEDFAEIATAETQQLSELLMLASLIIRRKTIATSLCRGIVTYLAQKLLLEQLDLTFVLNLRLLVALLHAEELLFLQLVFAVLLHKLLSLLLRLQLKALILALQQFEVILNKLKSSFSLSQALILGVHFCQDLVSALVQRAQLGDFLLKLSNLRITASTCKSGGLLKLILQLLVRALALLKVL